MRFPTVRELTSAFPSAAEDVGVGESEEQSVDFVEKLIAEQKWAAAIAYCAYLLPRWEAVRWGHETMRQLRPSTGAEETMTMGAVEAWLREPEERSRRYALERATVADPKEPATWLAFAAGWSGGSIVPVERGTALAQPEQTPRAVRAALLIAIALSGGADPAPVLGPALHRALKTASGNQA